MNEEKRACEKVVRLMGIVEGLEMAIDFGYVQIGPCTFQEIDKDIIKSIEEQIEKVKAEIILLENN